MDCGLSHLAGRWVVPLLCRPSRGGGLEEERRLFYVASTRAKDQLTLCHPLRTTDIRRRELILKPSRFLLEIPEQLYERWHVRVE